MIVGFGAEFIRWIDFLSSGLSRSGAGVKGKAAAILFWTAVTILTLGPWLTAAEVKKANPDPIRVSVHLGEVDTIALEAGGLQYVSDVRSPGVLKLVRVRGADAEVTARGVVAPEKGATGIDTWQGYLANFAKLRAKVGVQVDVMPYIGRRGTEVGDTNVADIMVNILVGERDLVGLKQGGVEYIAYNSDLTVLRTVKVIKEGSDILFMEEDTTITVGGAEKTDAFGRVTATDKGRWQEYIAQFAKLRGKVQVSLDVALPRGNE